MLRLLSLAAFVTASNAQLLQVDGSGTTNPSKYFWKIMETMEARLLKDVRLTYRAVGSSTGQREFTQQTSGDFTAGLTDFAAGDIPMDPSRYSSLTTAGRSMVHVPFCLGAIGVFHSVPAGEVGDAKGLKLSPCVLAKIMKGEITTWDHQDIKAENPNLNVPAGTTIKVGHRTEGSSSTTGFTGYLNSKCPADWSLGSGSTVSWPTSSGFTPVQGSGGMASFIAGTPYAIGYLDAGHGHQQDFQEVNLKNEADTWLNSKDALMATDANGNNGVAAAGKAAAEAAPFPAATDDWSSVNLYGKAGTNTWPIVLVSYLYLHKDWSSFSTEKAAVLKAFVDFVLGSEGQGMLSDFSFVVVPAAMNTWQSVWDNTITKPTGFVPLTFESNTEKWVGQGANVVSSKRNSYSLWKLGDLESSINSMKERLDSMQTHLDGYGIVPLHGSGTTNTKNWFAKAMKLMEERARVPLFLTYRAVGSGTGQKEFVGDSNSGYKSYSHFGAGDIPMSGTHFQTMTSQTPLESMVHIPLALGAIGVFHSVPDGEIGGSLKLDACLLAKIFSGQVETWDHADIKAQNPGINVPAGSKIKVFHRRLGSSSTGGTTGYLLKKCPEHWSLGAGSSISWPAKSTFKAVEGSPGMQSALKDNQYGIGYLDAGHGHDFGLSEVALTNLAGQTRTSKESIALGGVAEAGTAAANGNVFPTDVSADWSSVNLYDMAGDSTWPIVLVSYLYVKKDQSATNPKTAAALKAFIKMVVDDTDGMAQQFGFTPPSADLKRLSNSAADAIAYPSTMQAFDVESSTNAYGGMATNVISMKRHSYDIYDSNVMRDALSKLETDYRAVKQEEPMKKYDNTLPVLCSVVALVISLLTSCMACFAFKAAKSAGAAPPALPQAESGTIIGLAAPMPKEEKKAVDLKDEEKGKVDPGSIANL
mmetsp:Transcript_64311/g.130672  ORF Transcript_64311/g.130672 Transcript_64311/m.130672 type:complete len:925 (-) Transcript_64311:171-2945(-)